MKKFKSSVEKWRRRKAELRLVWRGLKEVHAQLKYGVKTKGRGTPVISVWPAGVKKSFEKEPLKSKWAWETSHPDGDAELVGGQLVQPPLLGLVYVRWPGRRVVVQLAWERVAKSVVTSMKVSSR